jgi:1,2-diacylglycerol 3-beta-galactosyltransferase
LYDAIPGQETGNVDYVVENGAGVFAPASYLVADSVAAWLAEGREGLLRRSENARRLSRPNAVWEIAEEVWTWAQHPPIATGYRSLLDDLADRTRHLKVSVPGDIFRL